ncbi:helix-turn-helix domain-containing protein [Proteus alimentorum]|uniref:Helix-turn-helix domain-containing protein n=1 Tax=Proteus alimentorum TaxID=1973495 RepID=A0ABS0IS48_9GAMM|nr:helix-turn-helix domain-containing protein [Proteus alimentorum]MBG2874940.1 helix-turn-helix domain-containing protein [Proteus alimentorum]MBG2878679.1 helix-turn-helix domain-containing protein [Proteus alimentorum]
MADVKQPIEMDITEVVKATGIASSAIRYYEKKGLINSIGRKGLKRVYHRDVLTRLALISLAQQAHFSLDEIAQLSINQKIPEIDRNMVRSKIEEIDIKISELIQLRDGLEHILFCPEKNHFQCKHFQDDLALSLEKNKNRSLK